MGKTKSQSQLNAKTVKKKVRKQKSWQVVNPKAAGVDLASEIHYAAVGHDDADKDVRSFGTTTSQLKAMAAWLIEHNVSTVAMEATGVYWIPAAQILEQTGLEVVLVHPSHVKIIKGKKTDVNDCQWLQKLHTFGMLEGAFRPSDETCVLRSYMRRRDSLIKMATRDVLHMQKALDQMNVLVHRAVSDITGMTGMRIIKGIISGQRDPNVLAELRHWRCKRSAKEIAEALNGNFREEHLFCLQQALEQYEFTQNQIRKCAKKVEQLLLKHQVIDKEQAKSIAPLRRKPGKSSNEFVFDGQVLAKALVGVDLTNIDGLRSGSVLTILSETGWTLEEFKTSAHFCSWLALCPGNNKSGGKSKSGKTRRSSSRAAGAFRMAAQSCHRVQGPIGDFYRRMKARQGPAEAVTSTAHKIARIFYKMVKEKVEYNPCMLEPDQEKVKALKLKSLQKRARKLGMALIDTDGLLYT